MSNYTFIYKGKSRDLKKIITAILKSWLASNVYKVNYWQEFKLNEKKVEKSEIKFLMMNSENKEKLSDFLSKNFPKIEEFNI
jgi:hypothetical protein